MKKKKNEKDVKKITGFKRMISSIPAARFVYSTMFIYCLQFMNCIT